MEIHGKLVDIHQKVIFPATITVEKGIIVKIERNSHRGRGFILPGFVDAHIQIESTLLPPSEFARLAVRHGTVATVGPAEVMQKVLGEEGIEFMRLNASMVPLKFYFNSSTIDCSSTTLTEARKKKGEGKKIGIKNLNVHYPLLQESPDQCMFCTDHLHPDNLLLGHINLLVRRAIQKGMDLFEALKCASKNPIDHYELDVGLLREGDPADFIVVEDMNAFRVLETYIDGECVFRNGPLFHHLDVHPINKKPQIRMIDTIHLKYGAIASSFIAFGALDTDRKRAIQAVMDHKGGLALSYQGKTAILPLPIAGLMSTLEGEEVARLYGDLDQLAKSFGLNHSLALLLSESYV
ncbi:MAG: amidohydrolase family protein [Verrucomicrobia bacterium]|nr:amidohydrolase family protein [Verrucomicrobiota bacterium]